jgi:hypothetical protein
MSDRKSKAERNPDREDGIKELRRALERSEKAVTRERRRSRKWEREAVFRASTVAAQLAGQILAAQRLASVVERHLGGRDSGFDPRSAEMREALSIYRNARAE